MTVFGGQLGSSTCPIGVDIGGGAVKLVQLERAGDGLRVIAAARRPLPATRRANDPSFEQALVRALSQMLAEGGFRGTRCVSALPAAVVQFKNVRLPKMPPDELAAAVQWEAAERLGQRGDGLMTQYFDAGEVRQGDESRQEVIVMSAKTADVEGHTATLTDAGLTPVAIEVAPAALARLTYRDPDGGDDQGPDARVIVDIGYTGAKVLVTRAGRVLFCKHIDIGGQAFDRAVAVQLDLPTEEAAAARIEIDADSSQESATAGRARVIYEAVRPVATDLAREIGLCVRYYSVTFRGKRPESMVLVGGEAHHNWLAELIADQAGLAVGTDPSLAAIDPGKASELRVAPGAWVASAHGSRLGQGGGGMSDITSINFLPPSYVRRQARRRRRVRQFVLAGAMVASLGVWWLGQKGQTVALERYATALEVEASAAVEQRSELVRLREEHKLLINQVKVHRELAQPVRHTQMIGVLGAGLPDSVTVTELDMVTPDEVRIEIEALAPDDLAVATAVAAISDHPLFDGVRMESSRQVERYGVIARKFRLSTTVPLDRVFLEPVPGQEVAHVVD